MTTTSRTGTTEAALPEGWEVRHDALGQPYYLELATHVSRREPPSYDDYRARFTEVSDRRTVCHGAFVG